ncbi:MAG: DUF2934 domain-containing protein [Ensifer sp. SSB1]|nr:DUF2934 domain-containing protein [Ensifer sp. SSB1]
MDERQELIRRRAYAIWESEGRPEGQDQRHWEQACRELAEREHPHPTDQAADDQTGTLVAPSTAPHGKAGRGADDA